MKVHLIQNKDQIIKCELKKRKKNKNISMTISSEGIVKVSLPYYTPYISAKAFINNNLDWIKKRLDQYKLRKNTYYYLGENISVIKKYNANIKNFNYILDNSLLIIETNDAICTENEAYVHFLKDMAIDYITKRVKELSIEHGFKYNSIKIKNLTSRWGSCSAKKNLSFNLKLMYFNHKVIDYVIIHELCHLKEMNHSKKFWKLVENILPNYKESKLQLNR